MADQECWSMDPDFQCPTAPNARVAYHLTLLRSGFCESFERILHLLSVSVTSPQASIRCRSLKALLPILEADPFIIDHTPLVKTLVSSRMKDISVAVRESSLRLISRCRELTPQLGVEVMPEIVRRVADDSITIRRRAMKILTEMYLHHPEGSTSSGIAEALLHRVADLDQTVRELACQSLAEIWISPYQPALTGKGACRTKLAVVKHLGLIARTVQRNRCLPAMLTTALQTILVTPSQGTAILHVYQLFVARMFEMIETPTRKGDGSMEPAATFQVLLIFAKINAAHIFTTQQIQLLQPYVGPIGSADDMSTYRSVVSILSHVLPRVSNVDSMLLRSISTDLIRQVSRFNRPILHEVIRCLQTLSEIIQDKQPLTRLTLSCLENIRKMVGVRIHDPADQHTVRKIKKLLLIAGMCGRHCNFEAQLDVFQTRFGDWRGQSVSELMIATFSRFSSPGPPTDLRMAALDAICMVCQLWPKHFASAMVSAQFEKAFEEKDASLETIILTSFKELLLAKEQHSEANDGVAVKLDHIGGSQLDRVAAFITQTFMSHRKDLTRIALATQDEQALLAVEVLASMHRQGLLHPKEYAPICIALETSHNRRIADLSYRMHQILHAKYETIIAKEYMRAVDVAYEYQRDVVGNVRGATCDPYLSILNPMVEVIKAGRSNGRTKFHESLCTRIDLDLSHTSRLYLPRYLQRSQFILEDIAFFEYASVKDLTAALIAMEKVFTRSGVVVVDAIATEILGGMSSGEKSGRNDPNRLQVLAAFSTVLASLWHTKAYLTQQYGLSGTRGSTPYETSKDSGKAPSKVDNINGRALWERSGEKDGKERRLKLDQVGKKGNSRASDKMKMSLTSFVKH
ncbi:sister chromatid cohesion C-terminus-domain-containing protein, partial [Bisporella sp. PMI_857]